MAVNQELIDADLARSIEEAQATTATSEATIQEAKRDWNIL